MALLTPDRAVWQGDHGIQDGPLTLESSAQIEHISPYALLAVPRALLGHTPARASAAEATLLANSERLITHFDLYATLRALMGGDVVGTPPPPRWSRDLLATPIEQTRDCAAARVPAQFCPCDDAEPRHVHEPSFGICHGDQGRGNRIGHAGRYCSRDTPNPMLDEPELKQTEAQRGKNPRGKNLFSWLWICLLAVALILLCQWQCAWRRQFIQAAIR